MIQIYHNPRCGKSRNCLAFVTEKEAEVAIVKYLETPPTENEIKEVLQKLNFKPIQLVRTKESIWIENYKNKTLTDEAIIQAMVKHPILIERPIVIKGDKAIIGRIPEEVAQFI
ncbi:arsenate reductase (glutaredoxin) [Flavobacterium sp.]|uniref:arsenate reductase (glutaredoxin) n=1 Tax=Flavobacterium sp. TaxID=239 RepID=UPI0025F121B1|nr:arsenate reductase (glutaredoxin) [Flavobacterium sp.]